MSVNTKKFVARRLLDKALERFGKPVGTWNYDQGFCIVGGGCRLPSADGATFKVMESFYRFIHMFVLLLLLADEYAAPSSFALRIAKLLFAFPGGTSREGASAG